MSLIKNLSNAKKILFFSLPIIAGQIGQMLFGIGDVLVASRFSNLAVGSIGVASTIFAPFLIAGMGVLLCTGPLASQAKGSGDHKPTLLFNAYCVSAVLSVALTLIMYFCEYYVYLFELTPELVPHVITYLKWTSFSIFPALIFQCTKDYLQAQGKIYMPNAIILIYNVINVGLNYVMMFGLFGFKGFGIEGAAIATLICRYMMGVTIFLYMKSKCEFQTTIDFSKIKEIFKLGIPISFTLLCEVLIFSVVTVLVGGINLIASAAQSIVVNITSLTFMIPLGLGSAISILVGTEFGKKSMIGITDLARGSLILVVINQMFFAAIYLVFPNQIIGLATADMQVITYGAGLLFWVGIFQIPDGLQVVLSGILRGLNETKAPMVLGLISYWVIGLPIGYYFAFTKALEARGLWMGLALGLSCMCVLLIIFYRNRIKKLHRLMSN